MAAAFNLTAQLNLQGPTNLKPIVSKIKKELGSIKTTVDIDIKSTSIKNITAISSKLNTLSKSAQNANTSVLNLNQSLSTLASGFNALNTANTASVTGVNNTVKSLSKAKSAVADTRNEIEEFGKQSGLAIRRFAAFSVVTGVVYSFTSALGSAFKEFASFNKEVVRLSQVTGKSVDQLKSVSEEITRLSTGLGVASADLLNVSTTLAQAGLSAEDTRIALEALAKSSLAPSFEDIQSTTEGAIAAIRQFGLQANELESALGSINSVAAAFAVESGDIITAIQRTGGVFAASSRGVSEGTDALNEFISVFTSVRATTRESAESIATGLRTIFTRIQRGRTIDFLKQFGVDLTDLEGKFVGPYKAIERLSAGLQGLDPRDLRFSQIIEELGGFRQIGKVIPLIQQFATAEQALKVAQKGQGSLAKDAATAQQSLAVQFTKTREAFLALVRDIGDSTSFQAFATITLNLANSLITLAGTLKPLLPLLITFATIKAGAGLTEYISGFAKGFTGRGGKGGAGGTGGTPSGPTPSPAGPTGGAQGATNNVAALTSNTSALTTLTNAINALSNQTGALTSAVIQSNTYTKSKPPTRGFATGGLVPGSGNRDTVPAALTPGEFVIKKSAVNAIGTDNLHRINKYAKGGLVKPSTSKVGFAILSSKLQGETSSISAKDIIGSAPAALQNEVKSILATERGSTGYTLIREGLNKSLKKKFDNAIDGGLRSGVNATIKSLSKKGAPFDSLPVPTITKANVDNFLSGINPGARGAFFEEILTSIRNQGKYNDTNDPNRPFDFPDGLGAASDSENPIFPSLKGVKYVDAKSSTSAAKPIGKNGAMSSKIASQLLAEEAGIISGAKKVKNLDTLSSEIISKLSGKRTELDSLAFRSANITATIPELMKLASQPNSPIELVKAPTKSGKGAKFRMKPTQNFALGGHVQKLAKGGFSRRVGVFDFDETTAVTKQRETPSLSGFKNPKLAVPDILSGQATLLVDMMKKYGFSEILTARSGGPKGEMRGALKTFFKRNGVYLPDSRIITTGDQVSKLPTAERKARALFDLVKKYGQKIDFWDDNADNVAAASMVKGVSARLVDKSRLLKRNTGGPIGGSSTDTVPALLTPGEFVINKKSASKLGASQLHSLNNANKVQKFAKGGFVGVQKFARGGGVSSAAAGLMIFSGLQYQVDQLTSGFAGLDNATTKAIKGFIEGAVSLATSTKLATDLIGGRQGREMGNKLTATAAVGGALSGALTGFGSKSLESSLQKNTDALSGFKKILEGISAAPTETIRQEALNNLESSFIRLTKTFNDNASSIRISDNLNQVGKAASNVTSTFVTTVTTFMLISQQLKMARVAKQLGGLAQTATTFGRGLSVAAGAVTLFTKFTIPLAIATTALSGFSEIWSLFSSSVSSSKEQLLAHAEALKEVIANSKEYSIANKHYTETTLSLASKVLELDKNTQIQAFGQLQPSRDSNIKNVDGAGLNTLNVSLQEFIQSQLNAAKPGLGNVSVGDFASLSQENAALVSQIIATSLPKFIEGQFARVERDRPDLIKRTGLLGGTTSEDKRRAVESFLGEEGINKFRSDKFKVASREIQIQVASLTNIFSQLANNIKATSTSISNSVADLNTIVDIRLGEAKVQANPAFERASRTLSNLTGSSETDVNSALKVVDRLLNSQQQGQDNQNLKDAISSIQALRKVELDLPTVLERIQSTKGFREGGQPDLDSALRSYFEPLIKDSAVLNNLIENTQAIIDSNSRQDTVTLNREQLAAASQDISKLLESANVPLTKFIEILDQSAQTSKELASAQQRLIDTTNIQNKFMSEINQTRIDQEMDLRRALGRNVEPIELNKLFATELEGILGPIDAKKSVDQLIEQFNRATTELEKRSSKRSSDVDFLKIDMSRSDKERQLIQTINNTRTALEKYARSLDLTKNITDQINKENAKGIKDRDALFRIFRDSRQPGGLNEYAVFARQRQQLNEAIATSMPTALGANRPQQESMLASLLDGYEKFSFMFDENELNRELDKIIKAFGVVAPTIREKIDDIRRLPIVNKLEQQRQAVLADADKAAGAVSAKTQLAIDFQIAEISRLSNTFMSFEKTLSGVINGINKIQSNLDKQFNTSSPQADARASLELRNEFSKQYGSVLGLGSNSKMLAHFSNTDLLDYVFGTVGEKQNGNTIITNLQSKLTKIADEASKMESIQEFDKLQAELAKAIEEYRLAVKSLPQTQRYKYYSGSVGRFPELQELSGFFQNDKKEDILSKINQDRFIRSQMPETQKAVPPYERQITPDKVPDRPKSDIRKDAYDVSSRDMKTFDFFGKTVDSFKIAFGLDIKKFDTTIKALAAVFPTLNTPVVKFEKSVDKLVAKLDAIDAAGGIKGPNIPDTVKVSVSFDDSINVVADGNNQANLLAQIERITHNTVVRELKKMNTFGHNASYSRDA